MALLSGCIYDDGARYWGLVCWLMGVIEEIKAPCGCRGFVRWENYPVLVGFAYRFMYCWYLPWAYINNAMPATAVFTAPLTANAVLTAEVPNTAVEAV